MRYPRILAVLVLALLAAAPVRAQDKMRHVRYQDALLKRPLSPADKDFCDGKMGGRTSDNEMDYDKCHVTRLFLIDIARNADEGFPPNASTKYCKDQTEKDKLVSRL